MSRREIRQWKTQGEGGLTNEKKLFDAEEESSDDNNKNGHDEDEKYDNAYDLYRNLLVATMTTTHS
eukprot:CAMPEP_0195310012 /NCGR_PEP_ID=MMETSP0707-20130614/39033_1 /TAXON_ID=33640 /ORGANISM="Asterionellopsis glacialis, Strain CCMP134" /LENGTH=65 /DNA_ID=CAMNT_0040374321 /DNA_START=406 /DNA_END=604 /DNA_ORIENTATION=-